jgi:nucleoside-diphosphate-sugar epimerase
MANKTVAITGANGFLGTELVKYFSKKGWLVVALGRHAPKITSKNISFVEYDLSGKIPDAALKNVDFLVHAAYIKQDRSHPDAFKTNVEAAKTLIQSARKHKVKKCLFMSSMSAHDEAISAYGRQKLAIEKIFSGKDCVSIRSGLIVGNGGLVKQMVGFMRSKHMVPLIGGGNQPLQIIAIADLVLVIDKLLTSSLSGIFTVATPHVYTYKELYKTISRQLNIKVLFIPVPFFILLNALRVINLLPIPIAVNPDNALGLKQLRSAETAKDLKKIGVKLHSLEEALKQAKL